MDLSVEQEAELKLYPNRKYQLATVIIGLAMMFSCLAVVIDVIRQHQLLEAVAFALFLLLEIGMCWIWIHSFLRPTPTVTIDGRGLTYTVWFNDSRLVPWEDIQSIYSRGAGSRSALLVDARKGAGGQLKYLRSKEFLRFSQQDLHLPIPHVLQAIQEMYSTEVQAYNVQVL